MRTKDYVDEMTYATCIAQAPYCRFVAFIWKAKIVPTEASQSTKLRIFCQGLSRL